MKKMLNSGLALTLLVLSSFSAMAGQSLYILDSTGHIGKFDLNTDAVSLLSTSTAGLSDIAFTANGSLYGTSHTALYSINQITGASSVIGNYGGVGANNMVGLVGYGNNLLASSYSTSALYVVDVAPFSITALKNSAGGTSQGDLAFGPNGTTLYDTLASGKLSKITISGNSISSTLIGTAGSKTLSGLSTAANGVTYGINGTEIYIVDLSTDTLTPFYNYAGHGLGAAAGTAIFNAVAVPEPGNIALLFAGLAGLAFYQKRRNAAARA